MPPHDVPDDWEPARTPELHVCDCGHSWRTGQIGEHSCTPGYMKQVRALTKSNHKLRLLCFGLFLLGALIGTSTSGKVRFDFNIITDNAEDTRIPQAPDGPGTD